MKKFSEKMMEATGLHADKKIGIVRFALTYYTCFFAGLVAERMGATWEMD